jgi:hypothetical protein
MRRDHSGAVALMRVPAACHAGVAVMAFLLASCGNPGQSVEMEWAGSVDTLVSGRVLVRSPDAPTDGSSTLMERFRVGSEDAEGPDLFGSIEGLALGPEGEVYVLDGQASEVRVFDSEGGFERAFGGEGEGPGELSSPSGLALDSQETLWVMNWGNGRYTGFDAVTGGVRREVPRRVWVPRRCRVRSGSDA